MQKILSLLGSLIVLLLLTSSAVAAEDVVNSPTSSGSNQQITNRINLTVDGAASQAENTALQLASGHSVIALTTLQNLIPFQSEWGPEGELVLLWEEQRIQLFPGKDEMLVNAVPQTLEIPPYVDETGALLLPLRAVGEALGYKIIYDEATRCIFLNSPGYQPLPEPTVIPNQVPPVRIDYQSLPTWGSIFSIPGLTDLWKAEQIISGYFTRLVDSPPGRTTNIVLSSAKVNGTILQTGEVFSFNQVVGPRTVQKGYQNAKIFAGKKVITGIGGGVCQTSSTLYNVALEAGLQVLERYPHSLKVVYAPPQRDATVSWGGADFKFRNNKDYPIKILCQVDNGYVFAMVVKAEPDSSTLTNPIQ